MADRAADNQTSDLTGRPEVTIALPVYNEAEGIIEVLREVRDVADRLDCSYEIVVVDDGSTDGTSDLLDELSSDSHGAVRIVRHPYNQGNGAAVKTGIRSARGERLVLMDADGQHDPNDIPRLLADLSNGYDLVVGARTGRSSGSWNRNLANAVFNRFASHLTSVKILDLTSGFRAFKTPLIRDLVHLLPNGFSYPTTSTMAFIKVGHTVKFLPIQVTRRTGRSKLRPVPDGMRFLFIILRMITLFEPFRVFLPAAAILLGLALASFVYTVVSESRLHIPNSSVFLSVSAVLVFLVGLVAGQIAELRVSMRSRD